MPDRLVSLEHVVLTIALVILSRIDGGGGKI